MREEEETSQWSGSRTPTVFNIVTFAVAKPQTFISHVFTALFFLLLNHPSCLSPSPSLSLCSVFFSSPLLLPVAFFPFFLPQFLCGWTEEGNSQLIEVTMATVCRASPCRTVSVFLQFWFSGHNNRGIPAVDFCILYIYYWMFTGWCK